MTLDDMRYNLKKVEEELYTCVTLLEEESGGEAIMKLMYILKTYSPPKFQGLLRHIMSLIFAEELEEAKKKLMEIIGE